MPWRSGEGARRRSRRRCASTTGDSHNSEVSNRGTAYAPIDESGYVTIGNVTNGGLDVEKTILAL